MPATPEFMSAKFEVYSSNVNGIAVSVDSWQQHLWVSISFENFEICTLYILFHKAYRGQMVPSTDLDCKDFKIGGISFQFIHFGKLLLWQIIKGSKKNLRYQLVNSNEPVMKTAIHLGFGIASNYYDISLILLRFRVGPHLGANNTDSCGSCVHLVGGKPLS